jgi:hypothetical protein
MQKDVISIYNLKVKNSEILELPICYYYHACS